MSDSAASPLQTHVSEAYTRHFGTSPCAVVRAPGRVNLIGEHTDYNDGWVLPMAIDRAAWIAFCPRDDDRVVIHSLDFDERVEFDLAHFTRDADMPQEDEWQEYIKGTAWALQQAGHTLRGWQGIVAGDVPIGAGLSSSAALELATARTFAHISGLPWDATRMARLAQRAENEWVGVACGIMDQMISASGEDGHALLIDCRTLESQPVPLPGGTAVVVLDTGTRRGLVGSAYNERRAQCEAAARFFGVPALRDVSVEEFEEHAAELDEVTRRRARHVITENARTLDAVEAMRANDPDRMGRLMNESHRSLRDDFEVSSGALNAMVDIARAQPGCYGARMTGAGFGGCAVALVDRDDAPAFAERVARRYEETTPHTPAVYLCEATNGAEVVIG